LAMIVDAVREALRKRRAANVAATESSEP